MSIKKIKEHNSQQFLDDLKRVRDVMVIMPKSNAYLHVTKQELRKEAMEGKIHYYITDTIFRVVRDVMVVT
jgi:hypothetical protein